MAKITINHSSKHTLFDWCALHGINTSIYSILAQLKLHGFDSTGRSAETLLECPSILDALSMVASSLKKFFPQHTTKIEACFENVDFQIDPSLTDPNAPYTIDHGCNEAPSIISAYRQRPEDLMALAHECAHALQLTLSKGTFMPPIQREICAFLGEQILIDFVAANAPELSESLNAVWVLENQTYFGEDARRLADAARDQHSLYAYRWNYPVARMAAIQLFKERSPEELWCFFEGSPDLWAEYLEQFSKSTMESSMENYYPAMPENDAERPLVNAYRAVGAMALMDADYWNGLSEEPIDAYCGMLVKNLQAGTAFICVGKDMKPVGYATWDADADGITLTHRSAPFGDYLKLMKSLQNRIPNSEHARSNHERSARKEQVAW